MQRRSQQRAKAWQELEQLVLMLVGQLREQLPRCGARKLYYLISERLRARGQTIGRDRFFRLLREHQLMLYPTRRYVVYTTNSRHCLRKYPNLIQNLVLDRPNTLWVADITYVRLEPDYRYLSLITDAYSHKIVGYHLSRTLEAAGPLLALRQALDQRTPEPDGTYPPLIHHSDRGIQYCAQEYVGVLQEQHIQISMAATGDPYENAVAERLNGILKYEFDIIAGFRSHLQAVRKIALAVTRYNDLRPHQSCQYLTPNEAHRRNGPLRKMWSQKSKKTTQPTVT